VIIAIGGGRAGNQMFQLCGIESMRQSNEKIILVNFSQLAAIFPRLSAHSRLLEIPPWLGGFFPYVHSALKRLSRWRILGGINQVTPNAPRIARANGLIPVTMFWGGYCQDETILTTTTLDNLFAQQVGAFSTRQAESIPAKEGPPTRFKCFVHVRRGDYVNYPSAEFSAVLPTQWFLTQMDQVRVKLGDGDFFLFSDEPEWAKTEFAGSSEIHIVEADARSAFMQMSTCDAGILSPSTFSWWAAYFASRTSEGPFVAPDLWAGWRQGQWIPHEFIRASFLQYEKVAQPPIADLTPKP
jgi:hypothetical protein